MRTYKVTTPPTLEPVTPAQVKRLLRVSWGDDDEDLAENITTARQWLEAKLGKALLTQTIQLIATLGEDAVRTPISGFIGRPSTLAVELSPGPVQSVATVELETATNVWQALTSGTEYLFVDSGPEAPALLAIADFTLSYWFGTAGGVGFFPLEMRGPRLRVTYQAGYGPKATDVPSALREAVKQAAGFLYDNRAAPIPDDVLPTEFIPWRL